MIHFTACLYALEFMLKNTIHEDFAAFCGTSGSFIKSLQLYNACRNACVETKPHLQHVFPIVEWVISAWSITHPEAVKQATKESVKRKEAAVLALAQEENCDLPAAFADFIENELDVTPLVENDKNRRPKLDYSPTYQVGDKLMYFHVTSKTWLECEVCWIDWQQETYSVRTTFPNGNRRAVGRVPLQRLKPRPTDQQNNMTGGESDKIV